MGLTSAVNNTITNALRGVCSCTIAKVTAVNEDKVNCISLITEIDEDGNKYPPAEVYEAPILIPGSTETHICWDVQVDDIGLLVFANTELFTWGQQEDRKQQLTTSSPERMGSSSGGFIPLTPKLYFGNAISIEAAEKLLLISNENSTLKAELDRMHDMMLEITQLISDMQQDPVAGNGAPLNSPTVLTKMPTLNQNITDSKNKIREFLTDTYGEASGDPAEKPADPEKTTPPEKLDTKGESAVGIKAVIEDVISAVEAAGEIYTDLQTMFTGQALVVGAIGAPTWPTAAADAASMGAKAASMASAVSAAKTKLGNALSS